MYAHKAIGTVGWLEVIAKTHRYGGITARRVPLRPTPPAQSETPRADLPARWPAQGKAAGRCRWPWTAVFCGRCGEAGRYPSI